MIDDTRCEKALRYLANTDEEAAMLKANVDRTEIKAKAMKAACFLTLSGTIAEREAQSLTNDSVRQAYEAHFKAIQDFQSVANRRALQVLVVDCWRTIQANRRTGNV